MKKIFLSVIFCVIAFSFCGCGGEKKTQEVTENLLTMEKFEKIQPGITMDELKSQAGQPVFEAGAFPENKKMFYVVISDNEPAHAIFSFQDGKLVDKKVSKLSEKPDFVK